MKFSFCTGLLLTEYFLCHYWSLFPEIPGENSGEEGSYKKLFKVL